MDIQTAEIITILGTCIGIPLICLVISIGIAYPSVERTRRLDDERRYNLVDRKTGKPWRS
jgi:hypothetical protein